MQAVLIHAQIDVGDQALDNLAEGQGDDGQIVAVEAEDRHADEKAEDAGDHAAQHHGQSQTEGLHLHAVLQGGGHRAAGKGADAHKARVAQGQLAGDAHHQVEGQGHGHIGADGDQLPLQHRAHAALPEGAQQLNDQVGPDDQSVGKQAGAGGFFHLKNSIHTLRPLYTFSWTILPSRPAGFTSSTTMSTAKTMAFWSWVEM